MNSIEMLSGNWKESALVDSQENLEPMSPIESPPPTPKTSSIRIPKSTSTNTSSKSLLQIRNRRIATKTMVSEAIKALTNNTRKGFSLAGIRKYIKQHYLATELEIKPRIAHIKKSLKQALETGKLVHVKGIGLGGSFRVPSKKPKKSARLPTQREGKSSTKLAKQAGEKRQRKSKKPIKKSKIQFSAIM